MDFAHLVHSRGVRVLRSPALHFLLIGGLLFAALAQQGRLGPFVERPRLVIPRSRVALARRQLAGAYRRPLTPEEEQGIIEKLVDQGRKVDNISSFTLPSFSHIVRPAGPRISSMMLPMRSSPSPAFNRRRSVESCVPTRALVEVICSAKSTNRRSTTLGLILPRLDMT